MKTTMQTMNTTWGKETIRVGVSGEDRKVAGGEEGSIDTSKCNSLSISTDTLLANCVACITLLSGEFTSNCTVIVYPI